MSAVFIVFITNLVLSNGQSAPFTELQIAQMRGYFEANIGVSGCATGFVVASPSGGKDHKSGDPDYYYHWQRDAAVSMHTLQYTANSSSDFDNRFQNYVKWVQNAQKANDPNGKNVLGEPKFNCDGSVFSGGWCRPQNDGPASRAIAQITYANYLLDNNRISYVTANLFTPGKGNNTQSCNVENQNKVDCGYTGINQTQCEDKGCCWYEIDNNPNNYPWCYDKGSSGGATGTIPTDLDYVTTVWNNGQSCDLWEEATGTFFYTSMVQRYALYYGASLATTLRDSNTATKWINAAKSIDSTIQGFVKNGIIEDKDRVGSNWDCSVIVGTLYGGTPDKFQKNVPAMFPPSNKDVLNTISQMKSYWDGAYQINKDDDSAGVPGTLFGRYQNDQYPGCNNGGGSKGHSWILCSNAVADIYYRNALYLYENKENAKDILTHQHINIYANIFEKDQPKAAQLLYSYAVEWEDSINGGYDIDYINIASTIASMAASQGDNQLQRVATHVIPCEMHMSEQICEVSKSSGGGMEIGAHDLTWSYGTVLSAWYYRGLAIESGVTLYPNEKRIDDLVKAVNAYNLKQQCGGELCNNQCSD